MPLPGVFLFFVFLKIMLQLLTDHMFRIQYFFLSFASQLFHMPNTAGFLRRLAGFRLVLLALVIFLVLNGALFALLSLYPPLLEWLWLSADRPWGILTSAFSHVDPEHIISNVEGFLLAAVFFILINVNNSPRVKRRLSRKFLLLSFLAGIGANLLEYPFALANPEISSFGASGIVYGALGIVFANALQQLPVHFRVIRKWFGTKKGGISRLNKWLQEVFPSLLAFSYALSILLMLFFDISGFLNVAPEVDIFAHGVGFLIGFLGFTVWQLLEGEPEKRQRRRLRRGS